MYQWIEDWGSETSKRLGGGETTRTAYKYRREWADHAVDSGWFHERNGHTNPQMLWSKRNQAAPNVKLGAFAVPQSLVGRFGDARPLAGGTLAYGALHWARVRKVPRLPKAAPAT